MDMKHIRRVNKTLFFYKYPYKGYKEIKMKSLSQSEYGELRDLYSSVYETVDFSEELLDETFDELVDELIEEGYGEEEAIDMVDEATDLYIDSVLCEVSDSYYDSAVRASKKAAQGIDRAARRKRRAGQVRYAQRKAGEAIKAVKSKAKGAVAGAQIAGSIAKDEVRRAGRKAAHAVTSTPGKAKAAVDRKKKETKKGIKGFIKRQAQKVVNRMSEEIEELEATGLFSKKEIEAIMESEKKEEVETIAERGPVVRGQRNSDRLKARRAELDRMGVANRANQEVKKDPRRYHNPALRPTAEEVEVEEGYKEIDAKKHGRMYDRYKKLRSAAVQDARDSGEASGTNRMKMGKMSAVIDKSSENLRKKQTKDQLTGRG